MLIARSRYFDNKSAASTWPVKQQKQHVWQVDSHDNHVQWFTIIFLVERRKSKLNIHSTSSSIIIIRSWSSSILYQHLCHINHKLYDITRTMAHQQASAKRRRRRRPLIIRGKACILQCHKKKTCTLQMLSMSVGLNIYALDTLDITICQ